MFEKLEFNRDEMEYIFYEILEKYARDYNKKEIAALLAVEAEAAACLYARKFLKRYADYVKTTINDIIEIQTLESEVEK